MSRDRQFVSFNEDKHNRFTIPGFPHDESPDVIEALRKPMPLKDGWSLWMQGSGQYSVQKVVSFDTAQEFWRLWNGLPQPSELFDGKRFVKEMQNGSCVPVEGFMVFRNGIKPEWEDPANAKGGHFQIMVKIASGGGLLDEWWNNLVLAMVGETMDCAHRVTGVRLLDKIGSVKGKVLDNVRLEIWYHQQTAYEEVETLKKSLERTLITQIDGNVGAPFKSDMIQDKKH
jgi:translation initiation factor 4E